MRLVPIDFDTARTFVREHHRHLGPSVGWKFGIGLESCGHLVGVIVVGRPVARCFDDGFTLEATRCCTDGAKNAPSRLYGAAWRAAKAMGYLRLVTYTLGSEPGTSLIAAGFTATHETKGGSWDCPSRRREDGAELGTKVCWVTRC